jgi:hypothetical protein
MFGQGLVFGGIAGAAGVPSIVSFLAIAGGGAGGPLAGGSSVVATGGGNGGGFRTSFSGDSISGAGCSRESTFTFNPGITYTITVGAAGNNSVISGSDITTLTASAGAIGSNDSTSYSRAAGVACNQYNGGYGNGFPYYATGGGGAGQLGGDSTGSPAGLTNRQGGAGLPSTITGSQVYYSGGGSGSTYIWQAAGTPNNNALLGGIGGGGNAAGRKEYYSPPSNGYYFFAGAGETNKGGGGGGGGGMGDPFQFMAGPAGGGSGVVILRLPTAEYSGTTSGSPTITTTGTDTILKFTGSGSYTH